MPKRRKNQMV